MTIEQTPPASYWYSDSAEDERGQRVMEAMRLYRAAEMAMRRRTQDSMSMGENELLVLRYLTRAAGRHEGVTPVELARYLGVSTASTTALLDRLEKTGHLERRRHPTDRRKVLVQPTAHTEEEMRDTLGSMHGRMMQATRGMTEAEAEAVMGFLHRMRCAVDSVCDQPGAGCCAALAPSSRLRAS